MCIKNKKVAKIQVTNIGIFLSINREIRRFYKLVLIISFTVVRFVKLD